MNIIPIVILIIGCIGALVLGQLVADKPVLALGGTVALWLGLVLFFSPAFTTLIAVTFCLLPARSGVSPLGYYELFAVAVIGTMMVRIAFTKARGQYQLSFAPTVSILLFLAPLIIHGALELFSQTEVSQGKRLLLLAVLTGALCIGLMTKILDTSKVQFLPIGGLLVGLAYAVFELVSFFIPAFRPLVYYIYSDQNFEKTINLTSGLSQDIRLAGLRELGLYLGVGVLCLFALKRKMNIFFVLMTCVVLSFSFAMVLFAGYRSYFTALGIAVLIALVFRGVRWFLVGGLAVVLGIMGLIYWHHSVMPLPWNIQRTLTIFPGDWDHGVRTAALDGFDWRDNLREAYFRKYFPHSWVLGRGQVVEMKNMNEDLYLLQGLDVSWSFEAKQLWHSGFVSTLDYSGIVGVVGLASGMLYALYCFFVVYRNREFAKPWHVWVGLALFCTAPWFWYTGFFERSFPFFAIAISLLEIARREVLECRGDYGQQLKLVPASASAGDYSDSK